MFHNKKDLEALKRRIQRLDNRLLRQEQNRKSFRNIRAEVEVSERERTKKRIQQEIKEFIV